MQCNSSAVIEHILSAYAIDDGEALCYAVVNGLYTIVQSLLIRKVNPNARNKNGASALWLAAQGGHINIMKLLLLHGAFC